MVVVGGGLGLFRVLQQQPRSAECADGENTRESGEIGRDGRNREGEGGGEVGVRGGVGAGAEAADVVVVVVVSHTGAFCLIYRLSNAH